MESIVVTAVPGVIQLFKFKPVRVAFDRIVRDHMVPALLDLPGLADLYVGRQGPKELGPRLIVTIWESSDAMVSAVGESLERPIFLPEYLNETEGRELEFFPLTLTYQFSRPELPGIL
jgi:hypothetical protein